MADKKKVEVNLEMCSGFFRIPTEEIVYNITVLASNESSAGKVVEKIIEVEKIVEIEKPAPSLPSPTTVPVQSGDNFYQLCTQRIQQGIAEIDKIADSGSSGEATPLGALRDLGDMAHDLKNVLLAVKNATPQGASATGAGAKLTPALERLSEKITRALSLCPATVEAPAAQPAAAPTSKTITRYLFNLDAVFQTIYELCTNETVKGHIQTARARAEEIFDKNGFYDAISPKVAGYAEDDGFLTVPMTDIYSALASVCSDKAICNLLTKMDKQQAAIFLDQFLPLEVPPKEEVTVSDNNDALDLGGEDPGFPPTDGGLASLLRECQTDLDTLIYQSADQDSNAAGSGIDIGNQIEEALIIAVSIQHDATRLAEQGLTLPAGQEDPLRCKIKELATLAETLVSIKATRPDLPYKDALAAGQDAAQRAVAELSASRKAKQTPPPAAPPPNAPPTAAESGEHSGEASQDDIDRLLEELG